MGGIGCRNQLGSHRWAALPTGWQLGPPQTAAPARQPPQAACSRRGAWGRDLVGHGLPGALPQAGDCSGHHIVSVERRSGWG